MGSFPRTADQGRWGGHSRVYTERGARSSAYLIGANQPEARGLAWAGPDRPTAIGCARGRGPEHVLLLINMAAQPNSQFPVSPVQTGLQQARVQDFMKGGGGGSWQSKKVRSAGLPAHTRWCPRGRGGGVESPYPWLSCCILHAFTTQKGLERNYWVGGGFCIKFIDPPIFDFRFSCKLKGYFVPPPLPFYFCCFFVKWWC